VDHAEIEQTQRIISRREQLGTTELSSGSPLLKRVLANRKVLHDAQMPAALSQLIPPSKMKGLDQAAKLIKHHLEQDSTILIIGDFDCDGATSVALGMLALPAMGATRVEYLVPNRFEYGYGLTPEIVDVARRYNPDLIITVDNGISSISGVQRAKDLGWDVIITDHHLPGDELPLADVIVNPNQGGCEFPSKALAGVGVLFYVLIALRSELRSSGWFSTRGLADVNLANWLDIVALGTVADVVPLDANNRLLVAQGLTRINRGLCRPGIKSLLAVAKRTIGHIRSSDFGFAVGPRLNAAGRIDDISVGIRCLLTEDASEADQLAGMLNDFNIERREIEQGMQQEANKLVQDISISAAMPHSLCVYRGDWHSGVVGIVASRLKERYYRPTIVFADEGEGTLKGSGRSIPGLHLRDALDLVAKRHSGLLSKFGGHAMAAGLSLETSKYDEFCNAFEAVCQELLSEDQLSQVMLTDGPLQPAEINVAQANELETAVVWGQEFAEPSFDGEFWLLNSRVLGGKHLKMTLAPKSDPNMAIDAIAFGVVDDAAQWPDPSVRLVKLVYRLNVNRWNGRESVQLMVDHLEKHLGPI